MLPTLLKDKNEEYYIIIAAPLFLLRPAHLSNIFKTYPKNSSYTPDFSLPVIVIFVISIIVSQVAEARNLGKITANGTDDNRVLP